MKRILILPLLLVFIAGCNTSPEGDGRLKIEILDSPPPPGVEHIYLTFTEVSAHRSGGGWRTLVDSTATYDFLQLVNGVTAVLCDTLLESGHYTQMRLIVADTNEAVIDGETYPLYVPSGEQTGVKLNLDFVVEEGELIEICVDFDAAKSIRWIPGHSSYRLQPVFKTFKKVLSGTVAGSVQNTTGMGIPNALVEAIALNDTTSTLTDSTGTYKLILVEGTYELRASAEGYTVADTTYAAVEVTAGTDLTGYDFILW